MNVDKNDCDQTIKNFENGIGKLEAVLKDAIGLVKEEIKGKNRAEKLFAALKEKLQEFKSKAVKNFRHVKGDK